MPQGYPSGADSVLFRNRNHRNSHLSDHAAADETARRHIETEVCMKLKPRKGFTLLEMVIVVTIIAVLFLLTVPNIQKTLGFSQLL